MHFSSLLLLLMVSIMGCRSKDSSSPTSDPGLATPGHPVVSPSRKLLLLVMEQGDAGGGYWSFQIEDTARPGVVVFNSADKFYVRHTTYVMWDKEDRVWVYSGDIGTYVWAFQDTAGWRRSSFGELRAQGIEPPGLLGRLRPGI